MGIKTAPMGNKFGPFALSVRLQIAHTQYHSYSCAQMTCMCMALLKNYKDQFVV